jgi:hypothetical protein
MDKFNGVTFEFMKGLYDSSFGSGRRVVVITDNAKYHHARSIGSGGKNAPRISCWTTCTLQPGAESDRAGVETDAAAMFAQPLLSPVAGDHGQRGSRVRRLGGPERNPPPLMRNYLRRCV